MPGQTCKVCNGGGVTNRQKTINVKIPAGIDNGGVIRLRGLGYPGRNNGPKGDLTIKVRVMENQQFKREGSDIHTAVEITFPQGGLGRKGSDQDVDQKGHADDSARHTTGTVLRLKGVGIVVGDKTGDLLVTITLHSQPI